MDMASSKCLSTKKQEQDVKVVKDPIHGSIQMNSLMMKIINTTAFNRLKYIRQLGGLFYVYPGATHTRFEHSIGVCYLAGEFARMLQRMQPDLEITPQEVLCVEIAGLCHDLGHGPFSHLFDGKVLNKLGNSKKPPIKHEDLSLMILEEIYKELEDDFKLAGIEKLDLEVIKKMIAPKLDDENLERMFLYEIVANKTTGIDVDKWDYFIRDCHYMGLQCEFDWKRLMQLSHVAKVNYPYKRGADGKQRKVQRICYYTKEAHNILGMFRTRATLHEKAYKHKTVIAVENRLSTALLAVKDVKLIRSPPKKDEKKEWVSLTDIFTQITEGNTHCYLALNDGIIHVILNHKLETETETECANLEKAQSNILALFSGRDIFHCIPPTDVKKILPDESVECKECEEREKFRKSLYKLLSKDAKKADKEIEVYMQDDMTRKIVEYEGETTTTPAVVIKKEELFFEVVTISYGSEKRCKKGPFVDSNSEVLFFKKKGVDPKPLTPEEATPLFFPEEYTEKEAWIYFRGSDAEDCKKRKDHILRAIEDYIAKRPKDKCDS